MDKKIVKRAGGGAGIVFQVKYVETGDYRTNKAGKVLKPNTWEIGEFDALGYMDGMMEVDGSKIFKVIAVDISAEKGAEGKEIIFVSSIELEKKVIFSGYIRGTLKAGDTIDFNGVCAVEVEPNENNVEFGADIAITVEVTEEGSYWYKDVFTNMGHISDEDLLETIKDNLQEYEERFDMTDSHEYVALKTDEEKAQVIFDEHEDKLKTEFFDMMQDDNIANYGVPKRKRTAMDKSDRYWESQIRKTIKEIKETEGMGVNFVYKNNLKQLLETASPELKAKYEHYLEASKQDTKQARKQRIEAALAKKSADEEQPADIKPGKPTLEQLIPEYKKFVGRPMKVFDYNNAGEGDIKELQKMLKGGQKAYDDVANELMEFNLDYVSDAEFESVKNFLQEDYPEFADELSEDMDLTMELRANVDLWDWNIEDLYSYDVLVIDNDTSDDIESNVYGGTEEEARNTSWGKKAIALVGEKGFREIWLNATYGGYGFVGAIVSGSDLVEAIRNQQPTISGETIVGIHDGLNGSGYYLHAKGAGYPVKLEGAFLDAGSNSLGDVYGTKEWRYR